MGLGAVLIQKKAEKIQDIHLHSIFWTNILINWLAFIIIVFGLARLAIIVYKEDILYEICIGLSLPLLWLPFGFIQRNLLIKELKFKKLFFVNVISTTIGGAIGIYSAYSGIGIWSIIYKSLASSVISIIILNLSFGFRPKFIYSFQSIKGLLKTGLYDVGLRMIGFYQNNFIVFLIGYLFSPAIVGVFVFAKGYTTKLIKPFNSLIKKVFFPYYSKIQDDLSRIKNYHLIQINYISSIIFPIAIIMIFLVDNIIHFIWGEKWSGAVLPVQIFSLVILLMSAGGIPDMILKSIGKFNLAFRLQFIRFIIVKTPLALIAAFTLGFHGIIYSILLSQLIIYFIDYFSISGILNIRMRDIINALKGPIMGSIFLSLYIFYTSYLIKDNNEIYLSLIVISGLLIYAFIIYSTHKLSRSFKALKISVKSK